MTHVPYKLTENTEAGQTILSVFVADDLKVVDSTHPNFATIRTQVESAEGPSDLDTFIELFDIPGTIARKFSKLSVRVAVDANGVTFDGDPAQPGLSKQILRFLDEGLDVQPLVSFFELIQSNPSESSKTQAWDWLNYHDFTLTPDGKIIAYKGVESDYHGGYQSQFEGHAFCTRAGDTTEIGHAKIPNAVGDLIEIPRSEVDDDPHASCSVGLHVGTYGYALQWKGYNGALLKVLVDPRDIVSVPHNSQGQKIRVARYKVLEVIEDEVKTALDTSVAPEPTPEPVADVSFDNAEVPAIDHATGKDTWGRPIPNYPPADWSIGDRVRSTDPNQTDPNVGEIVAVTCGGYPIVQWDGAPPVDQSYYDNKDGWVHPEEIVVDNTVEPFADVKVITEEPRTWGDVVQVGDTIEYSVTGGGEETRRGLVTDLDRDRDFPVGIQMLPRGARGILARSEITAITKKAPRPIGVGDTVHEAGREDEDHGVVTSISEDNVAQVTWTDNTFTGTYSTPLPVGSLHRSHGAGGATSQAAKGRGLNPAQDPETGQFASGRPGSPRDPQTGRFAKA